MKKLLAFLLLCSVSLVAKDTALKPVSIRELSLRKVPLKEGERIASIEIEAAGASFSSVHIPLDWSVEIGAPVSGVAVLKGEAAHGVGMPFSAEEFQRFVTLAIYDHVAPQRELSIKVKLGLYLYDQKTRSESERVIELPSESVIFEAPNQSAEPTAASGRGSP